jgi:hypothetical protein
MVSAVLNNVKSCKILLKPLKLGYHFTDAEPPLGSPLVHLEALFTEWLPILIPVTTGISESLRREHFVLCRVSLLIWEPDKMAPSRFSSSVPTRIQD